MCGLVGVMMSKSATNWQAKDAKKIMTVLLKLDTYRGHHSTGVAVVYNNSSKIPIIKAPIPGDYFIETGGYRSIADTFEDAQVVIGHNRYATMGEVDKMGAHPHSERDVVLTHNGTLRQFSNLAKTSNKELNGLDSARIAAEIQATGSTTAALEQIIGAYALVWYDRRSHSLHFARNDERPLWWCMIDKQMFAWASKPWMLHAAADVAKCNIDVFPQPFDTEKLVSFDIDNFDVKYETKDSKLYYDMKGREEVGFTENRGFPTYHGGHWGGYNDYYGSERNNNKNHWTPDSKNSVSSSTTGKKTGRHEEQILRGLGLELGEEIEAEFNYVEYADSKNRTNGWSSGVSYTANPQHVVAIDVDESVWEDGVASYYCTVVGVSKHKDETVVYVEIDRPSAEIEDTDEFAKRTGQEDKTEVIKKIAGDEIKIHEGEDDLVEGPGKVFIPRHLFDELCSMGCMSCGQPIKEGEIADWVHNAPLCHLCDSDESVFVDFGGGSLYG